MLNPLAPPFMLYPLQLDRPQSDAPHSHPSVMAYPFPPVPAPPADFASPIPIGGMVAVQYVGGYHPESHSPAASAASFPGAGICWDPVMGVYRATTAPGQVYEQEQHPGSTSST